MDQKKPVLDYERLECGRTPGWVWLAMLIELCLCFVAVVVLVHFLFRSVG